MKKTIILTLALVFVAGFAVAQSAPAPVTLTIASGQSLSPAFSPAAMGTSNVAMSVLQIFPPAALDATSAGIILYSCTDTAGTTCLPEPNDGGTANNVGANLGSPYNLALLPASAWPAGVVTGDQGSYGAGWEIGAYVAP